MKFNYQARSKTGETQTGVVEASTKEAAIEVLKSHDLYTTYVEEIIVPVYAKEINFLERVTNKDVVIFSRQLAIMLKSRVPLAETFHVLARQTKKKKFRESILRIVGEIEGGNSLSQALSLFPKIFSKFYINMVKSGEASGKLTDIFVYLADYLEREYNLRSKIKGAMIYPAFVIAVFLAVSIGIITFIIPQLAQVLKESGQENLPWITKLVMGLADFMKQWIIAVVIVLIVLAFGIYRFAKTKTGKRFFNYYSLKIPVIGAFLKTVYLSRFALNLSTLVSGGLPIVQALDITGEVVGNDAYKDIILETKNKVKNGETISSVLEKFPKYVTPIFNQMVVVGEKTGTLDTSLNNVVDFYQRDIDSSLDNFIKLLEPILIIGLGLVVGGLMAAVLMPIYSMGGLGE